MTESTTAPAEHLENSQAGEPAWRPKYNPWLIGVSVSLAAFMEVLDTSIANVALPYIAGSLGASNDESTWVLTSYLVSNAIVLPISGWLADRVGRKRFFMLCIFLFTVSSLFCGLAPTLPLLLCARVVQGAGGGGLQPMAQAILADTFPPEQRGLAPDHWTYPGRLDYRQLCMALDFPYQPSGRALVVGIGSAAGGRPAPAVSFKRSGGATRLYWHRAAGAGHRRVADPTGQGARG